MPETLAPLAQTIGALLKERGETVAVAETSAGGLISAALLAVPGASAYYLGGGVLYTYASRHALLGLAEDAFEGLRPSTEDYALRLARGALGRLDSTWAIAETGAAGPSGNRYGDPAGHCCLAVAGPDERAVTLETGSADREANMWAFARTGLGLLEEILRERG